MGTSNKRLEEMFVERDTANKYMENLGMDTRDLEVQVIDFEGREKFAVVRYGENIYITDTYELLQAFICGLYFGA
jgi:hypothetical protein